MTTAAISKIMRMAAMSPRMMLVLEDEAVDEEGEGDLLDLALRQVSRFRRIVTESAAWPGGSIFRYHIRIASSVEVKVRVAKPKEGSR